MAHGGIISTLLDEVMSWTVIYFKKVLAVTRRMEVRYLRPVPVETMLTAKGEIVSDDGGNSCKVEAFLLNSEGKRLAKSKGDFAILSNDKLLFMTDDFRRDMLELIRNFP
jgi:acyl-coenzyme A thioesterase PaaI-like protein